MGFFTRGKMVKEFDDVVFSEEPGFVYGPGEPGMMAGLRGNGFVPLITMCVLCAQFALTSAIT